MIDGLLYPFYHFPLATLSPEKTGLLIFSRELISIAGAFAVL